MASTPRLYPALPAASAWARPSLSAAAATPLATIGGGSGLTTLNLNGAHAVAARSINNFKTLSAGGAAGGFAGVAGMVSFVDVENETRAGLYGVNATLRPTSAAGISVTANETSTINATTAAGATGSFGAGAAANIASLDSRVLADITGSTLSAPGAVSASATSSASSMRTRRHMAWATRPASAPRVALISVGTGAPSERAPISTRAATARSRVSTSSPPAMPISC